VLLTHSSLSEEATPLEFCPRPNLY
jgi:hypothetical protein